MPTDVLELFHPPVGAWFRQSFPAPTRPQVEGWPALVRGESTLILAPTGSGKTLTAFLHTLDRLMFGPPPQGKAACRVVYISPIKALAVDVERNLRAPLMGIARTAQAAGTTVHVPEVAIRTGDTAARDRARFTRESSDILITTPESLYLLLTSQAREVLINVDTVIIDEIHAVLPTKRGAHLALSLERLEWMTGRPLQRIGLSATQRPLGEVARFLGGSSAQGFRPVTIVDTSGPRPLELTVEVPVEDMARMGEVVAEPPGRERERDAGTPRTSIWSAIYPRLVELVKAHRTTLLFVNARRSAERLAGALNELAGEVLVHAHHGSLARDQRQVIEDKLKLGQLKGLVATSSLELGIDMGAIDLVVQIEAPPSVASGLQRVGRSGHQVGGISQGIIFPKYRQDLVACAALTGAMRDGQVESTRYPRNPLDILAQQIVAMVSMDRWTVDELYEAVRRAAPFSELSRPMFESVLDLLSGHYPSEAFADLRPRLTWDRLAHTLTARDSARRVAIVNGGTIPDRGLYGVFLAGAAKGQARVGELDEEMVFESRTGDTFVLGASTWRIEEITFDRVLVSPAPGEPGRMPFWRGEQVGRPREFGQRIGALVRELKGMPQGSAVSLLMSRHRLEEAAARNLLRYIADQDATGGVPDDRTVVVERGKDELGDWRVCVLSPLGGQILAPWSMAVAARVRELTGAEVETMWTNDGFVVRLPESDRPPDLDMLIPPAAEVERLVVAQLSATPMFAARFREAASRALLLTRKRPGQRTPLWQLRKRSQDLLEVASRFPAFPIILEAYRECLRDIFDMPALVETLKDIERRAVKVVSTEQTTPSPFAAALLFGYVANFLYEGDVPLAERRAQALAIDAAQLRELLGDAELRELLDGDAMADHEATLQHLTDTTRARSKDGVHDLLLRLGDLSTEELERRTTGLEVPATVAALVAERRVVTLTICGQPRHVPVEYAGRYRDALGVPLPVGLPEAFLHAAGDPLAELVMRHARTHAPFPASDLARRYGLSVARVESALQSLTVSGKLLEGAFRPGGREREWTDPDVLRTIRRRSLARLRKEIEPVEPEVLGRMVTSWQGVVKPRRGLDALLDTVEKLQGLPIPASALESEVLPARIAQYLPSDLDALAAAGEVVWVGLEPMGERDGRVALYLTDHIPRLYRPPPPESPPADREARILEALERSGASFFAPLHEAAGGGFPQQTVDALWSLVWKGLVTNDSFYALRAMLRPAAKSRRGMDARSFRSRRASPAAAEGRWTLLSTRGTAPVASQTEWATAVAQQLLTRYGVVTREVALAEGVPGGFAGVSDVFKAMEEAGRIRRGYFVNGVGAMQFALPPVLDLLRSLKANPPAEPEVVLLSAVDPANPYGAVLPWPPLTGVEEGGKRLSPMRVSGAFVVLVDGALRAWIGRSQRSMLVYLPESEPDRSRVADAVAAQAAVLARRSVSRHEGVLVVEVNGAPTASSPLAEPLERHGFTPGSAGFQMRRWGKRAAGTVVSPTSASEDEEPEEDEDPGE